MTGDDDTDAFEDVPTTDLDDAENQREEDVVESWTPRDVHLDEGDDDPTA